VLDAPPAPEGHVPAADFEKVNAEREHYRKLYLEISRALRAARAGIIVGKKAERFEGETPQLTLDMLDMLLGGPAPAGRRRRRPAQHRCPNRRQRSSVREHERGSPGAALPEHLPRVEIEVLPPEVQRKGLDAYTRIGQEVREVLERRPASMVVVRIVRPKFVERTSPQDEDQAARQGVVLTENLRRR
jgi:transposase